MGDLESSKHGEVDGSTIAEKMGDVSLWFFFRNDMEERKPSKKHGFG